MRHTALAAAVAVGLAAALMAGGCGGATFGDDVAFLKKHTDVVLLTGKDGLAQVAVSGAYQGRVMTSTVTGPGGLSFGWINRDLIASGKVEKHMNPFGGEDRFWIGPEGGQFSIFFSPGVKFDFENWFTPAALDTEPFETASAGSDRATFRRDILLTNYSGAKLAVGVQREVRLLGADGVKAKFGVTPGPGVKMVAYESVNKITNKGTAAWTNTTGMLSVWILGMYTASPANTVVVPFVPGPVDKLGPIVNDTYFGKVPADRLKVDAAKGVLFFKADAKYRSKIGVSPRRAKPVLGSYDAAHKALTLVTYTKPPGVTDYVNSMWEIQKEPFAGDVVNSYNDGPNPEGKRMGNFYELETSSPAAALQPSQSLTHVHTTAHFQGPEAELDKLAQAALGVSLAEIQAAMK